MMSGTDQGNDDASLKNLTYGEVGRTLLFMNSAEAHERAQLMRAFYGAKTWRGLLGQRTR